MKHGSLFSGIGGFDLAAEWMGWDNVFHCEWMPFPRQVLKHYWPNSISYEDITKTDFTIHRGTIDLLSGGFPCQPYSAAGKRLGKADDRHLWPEMLRAIQEIAPRWVVGENVRGLVNWNGGLVFDEVQADLEACGYEVIPFLLPACAVNAPHRRDRVWFVAYLQDIRQPRTTTVNEWSKCEQNNGAKIRHTLDANGFSGTTPDTDNKGCQRDRTQSEPKEQTQVSPRYWNDVRANAWQNFPTQSPVCSGDDGLPIELDGITFPKWRNESIKAYGNAIVPQVAYQIFKAIQAYDNTHDTI